MCYVCARLLGWTPSVGHLHSEGTLTGTLVNVGEVLVNVALRVRQTFAKHRQMGECQAITQKGVRTMVRAATLKKCGVKFFSVFSAMGVLRLGVKFGEIFRVLRLPGFRCPNRKISPKYHAKNGVINGKFDANFTLLGRGADN